MATILQYFQIHFPGLLAHKYLILLMASSLEGFNTMIFAGFLVSVGTLSLIPAALICLAGEITNSYFWYALGYWGGAKPLDWLVKSSPKKRQFIEKMREYLHQYTGRVLFIMKTTFSFTIITLVLVGSIKYNLKKFSFYNFIGSVCWIVITFSIGYFFGQGYKLYLVYFKEVGYIILFAVIAFILLYAGESISDFIFVRTITLATRIKKVGEKVNKSLDEIMTPPDEK